jgi:hypothetical protein
MLEEKEIALARAELHVIEARGRRSDQLEKIARLKVQGKDTLEAEQDLGLFEAYLFVMEQHRDFLLRSQHRPARATLT